MALAARTAWIAGALVPLVGFPVFRLWSLLETQVEPPRWLALFALLAAATLLVALGLASLAPRLPAPGAAARRWLGAAYWGAVLLNLGLVGLQVWFPSPWTAPRPWLLAAVGVPAALAALFLRYGEAERALLLAIPARLGQAALAIPLLALPWIAWAAAHDDPRAAYAPVPPAPGTPLRPDAPRRVVLVTFDALRWQSTSLADPALGTTPHLAALAKQGTSFTQARAASDMTAVAMPAIGAGVRPGIFFRDAHLPGAMVRSGFMTSLAGHLRPAGYATGAFTMAIGMRTLGFDDDFDALYTSSQLYPPNTFNGREFVPLRPFLGWAGARLRREPEVADPRLVHAPYATRAMFTEALAFLRAHPDRAFAWIHVGVPHTPMADVPPPGDLGDELWPKGLRWITEGDFQAATPAQMADYRRIYHNWTRFGDVEFGRFLAGLEAAGLYDDTMVLVSADHGEDLVTKEHPTHAEGVITERIAHVPLVVRRPGARPATDDRLASALDVVPTVLDAVYGDVPAGLSGRSLLRAPDPDPMVHVWALHAFWWPAPRHHASIATYDDRYRYLRHWAPRATAPDESLVAYREDPDGRVDLAARLPAVVAGRGGRPGGGPRCGGAGGGPRPHSPPPRGGAGGGAAPPPRDNVMRLP